MIHERAEVSKIYQRLQQAEGKKVVYVDTLTLPAGIYVSTYSLLRKIKLIHHRIYSGKCINYRTAEGCRH